MPSREMFLQLVIVLFVSLIAALDSAHAQSLDFNLIIKPQRCIALREGQTCYQDVKVNWQAEQIGDYCLREVNAENQLFCWKAKRQGEVVIPFEGEKDATFVLLDEQGQQRAAAHLKVAWVYKKNVERESTWRLF